MNKTSLLMLIVGTILGIVIGYVTFSTKPTPPEFNIQAEGFGKINFNNKEQNFNIEIVQRVDADNLKVVKNIQMPVNGFAKSHKGMGYMIDDLIARGVLLPTDSESPQE